MAFDPDNLVAQHRRSPVLSTDSEELQPLLSSQPTSSINQGFIGWNLASCTKRLSPTNLCNLSKPAIAVLVVSVIFSSATATSFNAMAFIEYSSGNNLSGIISVYCFFALITLFSPLYGFLADVRCGRYGVLLAAIWLAFCAFVLVSVGAIITLSIGINAWDINYAHGHVAPILLSLAAIGIVLFAVGLGFYRANFVQFGLDQLLEAPSKSLALFIHWGGVWAERLGMLVIQVFLLVLLCKVKSQPNYVPFCALLQVLMVAFLLIILCFRRKWFYVEPGQNNPYKIVRSVLHYVKQHKYPIRRSAFTYSGDEHPSRMDFAKERYGGPFTTEQVEDVKTFFRILFVLLALGPVFALDLPTSLFMSIKFGGHTGFHPFTSEHLCGHYTLYSRCFQHALHRPGWTSSPQKWRKHQQKH